jgi:putative transcriptional regulator
VKNRLRVLRAERYWTQADLAAFVGSTRNAIAAVENGRREPGLSLAYRIAEAFENSIEAIFPKGPGVLDSVPPSQVTTCSLTANRELRCNLEALRAERLWSQTDMAERLGLSVAKIALIERGRLVPDVLLACDIAELLGKSVSDVFPRRTKVSVRSEPPEAPTGTPVAAAHEVL